MVLVVASCGWLAWKLRDDEGYTEQRARLTAWVCVWGALAGVYFYGAFSPAPVVVPFGLFFFGLSRSFETTLSAWLTCSFGYAALVQDRPSGYSFLPEVAEAPVDQISIETAQSKLDCAVLQALPDKHIVLGVIDLSDMTVETPAVVAARIRRALPFVDAHRLSVAPDCGMKYLPRAVAFGKMEAMVEGARLVRAELGQSG